MRKYVNQHTDWLHHSPYFAVWDNSCFLLFRWSYAVSLADITAWLQTNSRITTAVATETARALWITNWILLQVAQAETGLSDISGYHRFEDGSSLFLAVMQIMLVVVYRHFGTAYRSHNQESRGPRTAWHLILCTNPEKRNAQTGVTCNDRTIIAKKKKLILLLLQSPPN